ncbi:MAG: PH domain-containing protein [Kofleriaceae bacterium]|jgi:hypothetical protein|nr:PH domain-containing protein [Kofleriaceae bacterium]MBP9170741.1 PH domain-containing protein [Kofleriaceae bacterium]MBP9857385.1 PH domain-containing protein [Kofleriaceae bacterium]
MIDFKNGVLFKLRQSDEYADVVRQLLLPDERVVGAFKAGRDGVVFTDRRVIAVNVQGLTGKKRDFTSLPYAKVAAFSVETAGTFDHDAELELHLPSLGAVRFEFAGQTNVVELARLIGAFILV